jgi:hypothetical protein
MKRCTSTEHRTPRPTRNWDRSSAAPGEITSRTTLYVTMTRGWPTNTEHLWPFAITAQAGGHAARRPTATWIRCCHSASGDCVQLM